MAPPPIMNASKKRTKATIPHVESPAADLLRIAIHRTVLPELAMTLEEVINEYSSILYSEEGNDIDRGCILNVAIEKSGLLFFMVNEKLGFPHPVCYALHHPKKLVKHHPELKVMRPQDHEGMLL